MSSAQQVGPFPLIVGSTGHRDLRAQDREATEKIVREFLESITRRCPNTPLLLITSLNEGADRLVARVALSLGARMIVAMPILQAMYENDFKTEASKTEFRELMRQAADRFSTPLLEGNTLDNVKEDGQQRDRQNALVGAWIAQNCHYLITLWDGVDRKLVGHPPHILDMKLSGAPEPYGPPRTVLDLPDTGPAVHIKVARQSKPGAAEAPSSTLMLPKSMESEAVFHAALNRLDEFNRDSAETPASILPESVMRGLPESAQRIAKLHARAESFATRLTESSRKRRALPRKLAAGGFVVLAIYIALVDPHPALIIPAVALLAAACFYEWQSRTDVSAGRAADAHALAETLRVQFFWKLAGVEDPVHQWLLRRKPGEVQWIRSALRSANLPVTGEKTTGVPNGLQIALEHWLKASASAAAAASSLDRFVLPLTAASAALGLIAAIVAFVGLDPAVLRALLGATLLALGAAAYFRISAADSPGPATATDLAAAAARLESLIAKSDPVPVRKFLRDVGREFLAAIEQRLVAERGA